MREKEETRYGGVKKKGGVIVAGREGFFFSFFLLPPQLWGRGLYVSLVAVCLVVFMARFVIPFAFLIRELSPIAFPHWFYYGGK